MIGKTFLAPVLTRVRELERRAGAFATLEPTARLAFRLSYAIKDENSAETALERPVTIALIGGTGSGKSCLFNALIGRDEASPTAATRGFTRVPYVAASARDFFLLSDLRSLDPRQIECDTAGLAIIDTPDLDSVELTNRDVARQVIQMADLIVYVTIPDRIADFVIQRELREWAGQKRWFFVLNKCDIHHSRLEELRGGFDERLRQLGFDPDDRTRFLVSAIEPQEFELGALRRAVYSSRAAEKVGILRMEGMLGLIEHALNDEKILHPLREKVERLRTREQELDGRLREFYREALRRDAARDSIQILVQNRIWLNLAAHTGWIMGLVVWLKCRAAILSSAWQLARMVTRGPTTAGIIWIAAACIISAIRGILPLRNLRQALGDGEAELDAIKADSRRIMEEEGLWPDSVRESAARGDREEEIEEAWLNAVRALPIAGKETARAIEITSRRRTLADDLLGPLEKAIDNIARQAARRGAVTLVKALANLLPTAVLLHAAWRIGEAWYEAQWLPASFYGLAISVFLLSLVPGYLLLAFSVRARTRAPDVETVVSGIERPSATALPRGAREELENLLTDADGLARAIRTLRQTVENELPVESFGAHSAGELEPHRETFPATFS